MGFKREIKIKKANKLKQKIFKIKLLKIILNIKNN